MQSVIIRGGLAAAAVIAIAVTATPQVRAQNAAAPSANPELAAQGEWNAATTYAIDDIVTARGSTWRSKRNNNLNKVPGQTGPSTANFWELFARGFNPTGTWSNAVTYHPDDLVTHNGQTYRAKITNFNKQPTNTTRWELLVARGTDGAPGPQGPAGPNTGVSAGTANAPAISFSGDSNTGIYSPSDGKIALVENGQLLLHSTGTFNTGVGPRALSGNNTGTSNTAVGSDALSQNTTGSNNTAVGLAALLSNTTSSNNTALGRSALAGNTTGASNTGVGRLALGSNTTGSDNAAIGSLALSGNTTGANNTALGSSALAANTTGVFNTAVGSSALAANTTGVFNTGVGASALAVNATGDNNTAVGFVALDSNTTGLSNTAVGTQALSGNTDGGSNTALGASALAANTTGDNNTAVGLRALIANTTGVTNIAIGINAGSNPTAPSFGIFIGNPGLAGDTATIKIGVNDTQTSAFIAGIEGRTTGVADAIPVLIDSNGQLGTANSSRRYKDDIETMADVSAMLAKLRPVTFRYKAPYADGGKPIQYGLIAEEVAEILPDLAVFNAQGQPETVKYHLLPSFLLAGYQAQQNTIAAQTEEIGTLKARLAAIERLLPLTKAAALQ